MNTTILNKCIEELKSDTPKIDYILGMLETVVAMSSVPVYPSAPAIYPQQELNKYLVTSSATNKSNTADEEEGSGIIAAYAGGPIARLE